MPSPTSMTMTTMPRSTNAADYEQPQSNIVRHDLAPPAYQKHHKILPMPHPPLQGFFQHGYPQKPPPAFPQETLPGYTPEHTYESMYVT